MTRAITWVALRVCFNNLPNPPASTHIRIIFNSSLQLSSASYAGESAYPKHSDPPSDFLK